MSEEVVEGIPIESSGEVHKIELSNSENHKENVWEVCNVRGRIFDHIPE